MLSRLTSGRSGRAVAQARRDGELTRSVGLHGIYAGRQSAEDLGLSSSRAERAAAGSPVPRSPRRAAPRRRCSDDAPVGGDIAPDGGLVSKTACAAPTVVAKIRVLEGSRALIYTIGQYTVAPAIRLAWRPTVEGSSTCRPPVVRARRQPLSVATSTCWRGRARHRFWRRGVLRAPGCVLGVKTLMNGLGAIEVNRGCGRVDRSMRPSGAARWRPGRGLPGGTDPGWPPLPANGRAAGAAGRVPIVRSACSHRPGASRSVPVPKLVQGDVRIGKRSTTRAAHGQSQPARDHRRADGTIQASPARSMWSVRPRGRERTGAGVDRHGARPYRFSRGAGRASAPSA